MKVPSFELIQFGRFDSHIAIPGENATDNRIVEKYEFDIFPTDQPGTCFIENTSYPLTRGTVLCAKPGQKRRSILPFRCHYIYLKTDDPELIKTLNALPDYFHTEDVDSLMELFHDHDVVSDRSNPNRAFLRQAYVYKFLHRIFQLQSGEAVAGPAVHPNGIHPHRDAMMLAKAYIRSHLTEPLSLATLASVANLSPNYFHRLFTARFGCTPNRYITNQRILAARSKLAYTDQSLAQIAMECGFSSQSYFTSRFTKETGKSPMLYRKEMQGRALL